MNINDLDRVGPWGKRDSVLKCGNELIEMVLVNFWIESSGQ